MENKPFDVYLQKTGLDFKQRWGSTRQKPLHKTRLTSGQLCARGLWVVTWVVVVLVFVEAVDFCHFLLGQLKVKQGDVLNQSLGVARLRDNRDASLNSPPQAYLCEGLGLVMPLPLYLSRAAIVFSGQLANKGILKNRFILSGSTEGNVRTGTKGRKPGQDNVKLYGR